MLFPTDKMKKGDGRVKSACIMMVCSEMGKFFCERMLFLLGAKWFFLLYEIHFSGEQNLFRRHADPMGEGMPLDRKRRLRLLVVTFLVSNARHRVFIGHGEG